MGTFRRIFLTALPKLAISRATGWLARRRLPRSLRVRLFGWYARRYGVALDEIHGQLADFTSLSEFFVRRLRDGARTVADAPLVWPCDGRVVTSGALEGERIEQVKGHHYSLAELLLSEPLARNLAGGSQATVYLHPGDYHRVHVPFDGELVATRHVPGRLFPVNPPAVRCIPRLFATNERIVFACRLGDGRPAAVVMVAALNVGDIQQVAAPGARLRRGDELGAFGFGSTTIAIVGPGTPSFARFAPATVVRMGAPATDLSTAPAAR